MGDDMKNDRMAERVDEVRALLLDNVLSACRDMAVEPHVQLGHAGAHVLDAKGHKMATLHMVLDERDGGLVGRVDVRCDRLRRAMHGRGAV